MQTFRYQLEQTSPLLDDIAKKLGLSHYVNISALRSGTTWIEAQCLVLRIMRASDWAVTARVSLQPEKA